MICEYLRVTGAGESVSKLSDLMEVTLRGALFRASIQNGTKYYSLSKTPKDYILGSMYRMQVKDSEQLKTTLCLVRSRNCAEESVPRVMCA